MATFEKLLFVVSLSLAGYAAYTLAIGFYSGVLCYQSWCAHSDNPKEKFSSLAVVYALITLAGLASGWRSYRNLKAVWAGKGSQDGNF